MKRKTNFAAVLLVLLGAASYGFISPIFKSAEADGWDGYALTFMQVSTGALLLWLLLLVRSRFKPSLKMSGKVLLQVVVIGACGLSLTTILYNRSLSHLDASMAIVLLFQYAWITILLESIRAKRWPSRGEWLAVCLIFTGTILAVGLLEKDLGRVSADGLLYGLLSAVSYSLFFFLAGFLPEALESFAKSAVMSAASLGLILLVQGTGSFDGSGSIPLWVWGLMLGAFGTVLPTLCFNAGIPKIGPGLAALLGSLELPVAVLAAYAMLGEPLSVWQCAGIALIVAGIMAAQERRPGSAESRPGSEELR
ncbi:EamA family transporter [Cohnella sp. CFH 77786]|uniref:DMT family transporter n=1 Tax=Cohnella sp. CFH 77786 TaxID=2662265 RepID=UPI001C60887F|nr:DMT family transporter [Cohnella sp. CFH 77786]MBW5448204.1 EamA family transporter [Cohnella sp. CFH 77786]